MTKKIDLIKNLVLKFESLAFQELKEIEAGKLIYDIDLKKERKMTKEEYIEKINREKGALEMCKVLLLEIEALESSK